MKILTREPVMLGAAVLGTFDGVLLLFGVSAQAQAIVHGMVALWIAWGVRSLSTPAAKAQARTVAAQKAGRDEALAQVASLNSLVVAAKPARKPAKKS